jgi:hypothetical protein
LYWFQMQTDFLSGALAVITERGGTRYNAPILLSVGSREGIAKRISAEIRQAGVTPALPAFSKATPSGRE